MLGNDYNSVKSLEAEVGYCKTKIKIRKSSQISQSAWPPRTRVLHLKPSTTATANTCDSVPSRATRFDKTTDPFRIGYTTNMVHTISKRLCYFIMQEKQMKKYFKTTLTFMKQQNDDSTWKCTKIMSGFWNKLSNSYFVTHNIKLLWVQLTAAKKEWRLK